MIKEMRQRNQTASNEIIKHYQQLVEYYPRYYNLMNRSHFFQFVASFAAGFFGGGIGVAATEIWSNWRNSSDSEFLDLFTNAVVNFDQSCIHFTETIESGLLVIIENFLREHKDQENKFLKILESVARENCDLGIYYKRMREEGSTQLKEDPDLLSFMEIIISNLRDDPAVSQSTLDNIRSICGLS